MVKIKVYELYDEIPGQVFTIKVAADTVLEAKEKASKVWANRDWKFRTILRVSEEYKNIAIDIL